MQFKNLNIIPTILKALEKKIMKSLHRYRRRQFFILNGRDLLGCAQTERKDSSLCNTDAAAPNAEKAPQGAQRNIRALVITPTRELALQIYKFL